MVGCGSDVSRERMPSLHAGLIPDKEGEERPDLSPLSQSFRARRPCVRDLRRSHNSAARLPSSNNLPAPARIGDTRGLPPGNRAVRCTMTPT